MRERWVRGVLALALAAILGWPAFAATLSAWDGSGQGAGAGLIGPTRSGPDREAVLRPLGLAVETARLVLVTEAIALPVGLTLALVLFRTDLWGRRAMLALMALTAFVPMPLHATAWLGAFGNAGRMQVLGVRPILVGWPGAAFVHAMAAIPWIVLLAGVGLRTVEPELEEAALLDLPAWRVLTGVTLRRGVGALAGAALAVAVLTAGDMTVTDLLQVRTYAEEAYVQFQIGGGPGAAASVALPSLLVLGVLIVLTARGLLHADPARLASSAMRGKVWHLGRWRVPLGIATAAVAGNLVALPLYGLVWRAGRVGGSAALGRAPQWSWRGLVETLRYATAEATGPLVESVTWAAVAATATAGLAWGLAWVSREPSIWRWVVAASVALALAAPGPVAGMALVRAYRSLPVVYDSQGILVMAAVLRTLPYALLVLWPAVRAIPPAYLEAAALDGCDTPAQVRRVALPLTRAAAVAAWGVAFVLALGELPATNLVCPPGTTPIAVVVWSLLHTGVESHLAGVALVMLAAIATAGLVTVGMLARLQLARPG
ncbi:MAG: iron ABC transporter permease [Singulisphaera sp.]|nr:iron ABC transporter permease [Singulisphaera sp.]